jgi:DNA-binding transcriptional LysR family regulator
VKHCVGIGVLHDFAARSIPDLVRILPEVSFQRSYFLLAHPDAGTVRRITIVREFVLQRFREERARFLPFSGRSGTS